MGREQESQLDAAFDRYFDDIEAGSENTSTHAEKVEATTVSRETIVARLKEQMQKEERETVREPVEVQA